MPGAMGAVIKWNAQNPRDRIDTASLARIKKEAQVRQMLGQKVTKKSRPLLEELTHDYNLGGAQ